MKIFVYSTLNPAVQEKLRVDLRTHGTPVFRSDVGFDVINEFSQSHFLLGNPPVSWFEHGSNLKFWQLDSAGFNQYARVATTAVVSNMGDFFSIPCAETMVGGLLAFYRLIAKLAVLQKEAKWVGTPLRTGMDTLSSKHILILGAGGIAHALGRMLAGFNCRVVYVARKERSNDIVNFETALAKLSEFDVVVNTLPGNAEQLVSGNFFSKMKNGSLYASVGRGNTTDESAMLDAITSGKLQGAVLDVTATEPLPANHPFWSMENVILTQHTGGGQKYEDEGKASLFLSNLKSFLTTGKVEHQVNLNQGY